MDFERYMLKKLRENRALREAHEHPQLPKGNWFSVTDSDRMPDDWPAVDNDNIPVDETFSDGTPAYFTSVQLKTPREYVNGYEDDMYADIVFSGNNQLIVYIMTSNFEDIRAESRTGISAADAEKFVAALKRARNCAGIVRALLTIDNTPIVSRNSPYGSSNIEIKSPEMIYDIIEIYDSPDPENSHRISSPKTNRY